MRPILLCSKTRRDEEVKYIGYWEYDLKDEPALLEKYKVLPEGLEKLRLFPPYWLGGQTKGFSLLETDDFEKIEELCHHYAPEMKFKIYPIIEVAKALPIRAK